MLSDKDWILRIKQQLERARLAVPRANRCIYRVPDWLKRQACDGHNDAAYIPEIISLGPYHRGRPRLLRMEDHKWRVLDKILSRNNQGIEIYLSEIKAIKEDALACYEGPLELNSNDFVEMLVLDGCFVLEFLRGVRLGCQNLGYEQKDLIFKESMVNLLARDMVKLENQIPMIVLEKLLHLQGIDGAMISELVIFALTPRWVTGKALTDLERQRITETEFVTEEQREGMLHLLDVFRKGLLHNPIQEGPVPDTGEWEEMIHCVVELRKSGVRFRKRRGDVPFWNVHFNGRKGLLEVPSIVVSDHSKAVFLNLIAYEQCHFNNPSDMVITDYVAFMDNLVDSAADVGHLHQYGIIVHHLGSDIEVANLFNGLVKGVFIDRKNGRSAQLYQQLNKYCSHKRNRWYASLRLEYLRNPWVITSVVAAFILLSLATLQTFYTMYPYYKPHH